MWITDNTTMAANKKNLCRYLALLCSLFFAGLTLLSCGGANTTAEPEPEPSAGSETQSENSSTTNLKLMYTLGIKIDAADNTYDLDVSYQDTYSMNLHLDDDGGLRVKARDVSKMVYRVCVPGSITEGCDGYSNATGGFDVDLVLDACGRLVDDVKCGSEDDTTFEGAINTDGSIHIKDVSIRMRIFAISDGQDGHTASVTDEGLMELKRLVIDLTTGAVSAGDLTAQGAVIDDKAVTLVSSGTISTTVPELGGASFIAMMEGEFNRDVFELLSP
ncbi:MAG: hypothetical protein HQM16_05300 [Deltaproteobacteria bacterium]|nr:hypothetical protein [Deltaproteobacteria bacterium]